MFLSEKDPCNHLLRFDACLFLRRILASIRSGLMRVPSEKDPCKHPFTFDASFFLASIFVTFRSRFMHVCFWKGSIPSTPKTDGFAPNGADKSRTKSSQEANGYGNASGSKNNSKRLRKFGHPHQTPKEPDGNRQEQGN